MNKHLIAIGAVIILLAVVLSGCEEADNFENTNKVELVSYSVISYKFGNDIYDSNVKLGDGFQYKEEMVGFQVSGIVRNIDNKPMEKIKITGKFYESNGNYLGESEKIIEKIPSGETRDFSIFFHEEEHLLYVDKVEFEFYASYREV